MGFCAIHALGFAALLSFAARVPCGSAEGGWKYFEFAALPVFLGFLVYLLGAAALVAFLVKLVRLRGSDRASVAWVSAGESDARDMSLPAAPARPLLAIAVRRRGRIERAILIGSRRSDTTLDSDEVRGLTAVFAEAAA